jgi:hypothetical protein
MGAKSGQFVHLVGDSSGFKLINVDRSDSAEDRGVGEEHGLPFAAPCRLCWDRHW